MQCTTFIIDTFHNEIAFVKAHGGSQAVINNFNRHNFIAVYKLQHEKGHIYGERLTVGGVKTCPDLLKEDDNKKLALCREYVSNGMTGAQPYFIVKTMPTVRIKATI